MSPRYPPVSSELGLKACIIILAAHRTSLFTHLNQHGLLGLRKMTLGDLSLKVVGVLIHTKLAVTSLGDRLRVSVHSIVD